MKKAHIRIYIQPEDYSVKHAQEFYIDLDAPLIAEMTMPLHHVTPGNEDFAINDLFETRKTLIMGSREVIAKRISNILAEKILETFESADTIDGYAKEELKDETCRYCRGKGVLKAPDDIYDECPYCRGKGEL
jgi:hypothetical protein